MILLAHNVLEVDQLTNGVGLGVYSAIGQFHALAYPGRPGQRPAPRD
jgi:hypothetical protein